MNHSIYTNKYPQITQIYTDFLSCVNLCNLWTLLYVINFSSLNFYRAKHFGGYFNAFAVKTLNFVCHFVSFFVLARTLICIPAKIIVKIFNK
jgi:hypothetical protein